MLSLSRHKKERAACATVQQCHDPERGRGGERVESPTSSGKMGDIHCAAVSRADCVACTCGVCKERKKNAKRRTEKRVFHTRRRTVALPASPSTPLTQSIESRDSRASQRFAVECGTPFSRFSFSHSSFLLCLALPLACRVKQSVSPVRCGVRP